MTLQRGSIRITPSPPVAARGADKLVGIASSGLDFLPDLLDLLLGALGAHDDFCVVGGSMSGILGRISWRCGK